MPWTAKSFKAKHNHSLSASQAKKASRMANAMLRSGVPEGEAIATANARAKHMGPMNHHKEMAGAGGGGNFGVKKLSHTHKANSEPEVGRKRELKDHERGHPKHNGYHLQPDHGPIDSDDY